MSWPWFDWVGHVSHGLTASAKKYGPGRTLTNV
jgi:hypothetical protein